WLAGRRAIMSMTRLNMNRWCRISAVPLHTKLTGKSGKIRSPIIFRRVQKFNGSGRMFGQSQETAKKRIGGGGNRRYFLYMTHNQEQAVSNAIDYIVAHWRDQPDLEALAKRAGYEATHFQKVFTRMVGISPKKLVQ